MRRTAQSAKHPATPVCQSPRYADNAAYLAAVNAAAARMVAERLLLPEDAEHAVELARQDKLSQLH